MSAIWATRFVIATRPRAESGGGRTRESLWRASAYAGGAPCSATTRNASPSRRQSVPNLASQRSTPFSRIALNTGLSSPDELLMTWSTCAVAAFCSSASASFFCRSDVEALLPATRALAFVPVERSLRPRVGLFAPLRDKVTSSAPSLIPVSVANQGSSLSILTESHDKLAAHSITPSAAIRGTKRYGKSFRSSAETSSLRLDVGGPDHLAPFLGFRGDQLAELSRRSRQRRAGEVSETGLHLRVVESRVDLLVELVDDLGKPHPLPLRQFRNGSRAPAIATSCARRSTLIWVLPDLAPS